MQRYCPCVKIMLLCHSVWNQRRNFCLIYSGSIPIPSPEQVLLGQPIQTGAEVPCLFTCNVSVSRLRAVMHTWTRSAHTWALSRSSPFFSNFHMIGNRVIKAFYPILNSVQVHIALGSALHLSSDYCRSNEFSCSDMKSSNSLVPHVSPWQPKLVLYSM
jgi:hypothetical protein